MEPVERVLVVRRADFFDGAWPQGFVAVDPGEGESFLSRIWRQGFFVDRPAAEANPEWKQPIPYCAILRGDEVFCVERTSKQSEQRLHGLLSIGLGGHVNPEDGGEESAPGIATGHWFGPALHRELDEELAMPWPHCGAPRFLGLLNDDSNAVGQVHMGLVFCVDVSPTCMDSQGALPEVAVRETRKMRGGFTRLAALEPLWQDPTRFESWSRLILAAGILLRGDRSSTFHRR
ncbi:MAG: hypothetical protein RIT25_1464 [Planctomycetota bacterium]|jgi:predicted NUDIX family phosphoesterase